MGKAIDEVILENLKPLIGKCFSVGAYSYYQKVMDVKIERWAMGKQDVIVIAETYNKSDGSLKTPHPQIILKFDVDPTALTEYTPEQQSNQTEQSQPKCTNEPTSPRKAFIGGDGCPDYED